MGLRDIPIEILLYLWTRDACMDVDTETEGYIEKQIQTIMTVLSVTFSDGLRLAMCQRIVKKLGA